MKRLITGMFMIIAFAQVNAQQLVSKTGHVKFFSSTPIEDIEAHNKKVVGIFNIETGKVQVSMYIKSFEFKKALMQEHFNENYMESEKYPKATFTGVVQKIEDYDLSKEGKNTVQVSGDFTIHGVTKTENTTVEIEVTKKSLTATATFIIKSADYNIEIPALVRENIAKEIEVTVNIPFEL